MFLAGLYQKSLKLRCVSGRDRGSVHLDCETIRMLKSCCMWLHMFGSGEWLPKHFQYAIRFRHDESQTRFYFQDSHMTLLQLYHKVHFSILIFVYIFFVTDLLVTCDVAVRVTALEPWFRQH